MPEHDPVERYVRAKQRKDVETALACFAVDAVVHDDGRTHEGADAIRAWMAGVSSTFELTYEVLGPDGPGSTLVAVEGNFPGSPITFRYDAEVAGDRITALTIAPA